MHKLIAFVWSRAQCAKHVQYLYSLTSIDSYDDLRLLVNHLSNTCPKCALYSPIIILSFDFLKEKFDL